MKIKTKILYSLLGMSLLVTFVGGFAVNRQHAAGMTTATQEAENVARVLGFLLLPDSNPHHESAQKLIVLLHETQRRDMVLVDAQQRIVADAVQANVGKEFTEDRRDEVGATIKDGKVRTFIEVGSDYPAGIKQIVVPVISQSGQALGAAILEYTPLYDELMRSTRTTTRQVIWVGFGCGMIAVLIALYMGRSIARPIRQLTEAATGFASGETDVRMPPPRKDEIGELATAFNQMMQKRRHAEKELRRSRDELEIRVAERTAELATTNEALQAENAERKRMEESLRLFRTLIDHSKDAIEVVDPVTARFVDASESAYRDLGYTRAELMALTVFDVTVGLDRAAFAAANARLKNSGRARFELERRRKDGSTFPIEVSLSLVTVDREYAVTIVRDITEHKRTEESLRLLSSAVEQAQESIMIVEAKPDAPSPTIFFVNPAFTQMTGYPAAEAIGKTPGILQGPRTDTTLASRIMQDLERNGEFEGEAINYRKDGTEFNVELHIAPIRNASGIITHFVVIQHDITVRKQLEAQRQRLANIVEASPDFIGIADPKTTQIQYINKYGRRMCGIGGNEDIGKLKISDVHPAWMNKLLAEVVLPAAVRDGLWEGEGAFLHRSGREIPVLLALLARKAANGEVDIFYTISRDITERKRAQVELEKIHKQLVEASHRGGMAEIATNVLHNVGNVLNSVNISTGLIIQSVKKSRASSLARVVALLQEHAHDLGAFITHNSRGKHVPAHLAQLSEHLLAEQETNVRELDSLRRNVEHIKEIVAMQQNYARFGGVKQLVNVVNLVEDSLRMNEGALSRHEVEVVREFEDVPPLNVEKHKILQILMNLLRNAKYACDDSERADKRLTVRVANGEGRIRISVIDNGVGIPPENLTRIFNHGFTTRKDGHGFGLHSGALAAKEMGGSLTVHSGGAGLGATFTLELPRQPPKVV